MADTQGKFLVIMVMSLDSGDGISGVCVIEGRRKEFGSGTHESELTPRIHLIL